MKAIELVQDRGADYIKSSEILIICKKLSRLGNNTILLLGTSCLLLHSMASSAQSQTIDRTNTADDLLEQIDRYNFQDYQNNGNSLNQVNDVSQLRDVSPTDWSYEALRGLVNRYGCISGFPDRTYRGNQPLSRYEFAAGLNACLNQIERLIAASEAVTSEDLKILQRLSQEFAAELATIGARIDNLEGRTAFLEDNQFSTTTKLTGEAVFNAAHIFTGDDAGGVEIDSEPVLGYRARLGFNTSFTGEDLLLTQFSAGNFPFLSSVTGTPEGDLGLIADSENNVNVLVAFYSFPVGDRTNVVIEGHGGIAYDFADTLNPLDQFNDAGSGGLSAFGLRNPIYNQVFGAGIGVRTEITDNFELSAGYLAPTADNPTEENGLFNGAYGALGQLVFKPGDNFKLGLTYVNSYNNSDTFTGSNLSNFNSFAANEVGETVPISSNSYGVEVSWSLSDRIIISGWGGYTTNRVLSSITGDNGVSISRGDQDIWNWGVTLALPDLLKEGNLGGIVVGMEPRVTDSNIEITGVDENTDSDTSLHVEAFYQYQLSDGIAVTPGVIWVTAPDHDSNNDSVVIGTLRTTFTF